MRGPRRSLDDRGMANDSALTAFSNQLADVIDRAAPSVVQVHGRGRPGSGMVHAPDVVLTTARALGGEDGIHVRRHDGTTLDAQLAGWDPTTNLAVLRVPTLGLPHFTPSARLPRVGHLAVALARSWSNSLTASTGIVSVVGGPLQTGRHRAIDQVIRTTAPMHDGFSGGAFLDTGGGLIGVTTAARIRGLAVVIPAAIAWTTAATLLEHGSLKRGYLGIAAQSVRLPEDQRPAPDRAAALLVVGVTPGSPAGRSGVLLGDVILDVDGRPLDSPDTLLDFLAGTRIGQTVTLRIVRGGTPIDVAIAVGERPEAG
jgi:S1-C subfamily serine protease